ncbi:hypothetical protein ACLOJK_004329 [Asimina triloba]
MGYGANRSEARREETEKTVSELRSVFDAIRAKLEVAHDEVEGGSLAKQDLERALPCQAGLGKGILAEQDEAIGKVTVAEEKVLQSSMELIANRPEAKDLYAYGANSDADNGLCFSGELSVLLEWIAVPSLRELELVDESETMWTEVTWLRMELDRS